MFHDFVEPRIRYKVTISRDDIPDKFVRVITRAKNKYWYRLWCGFMYLFVMDNSMASKIGFSLIREDDLLKNIVVTPTEVCFSGVTLDSRYLLAVLRYCYRPRRKTDRLSIWFCDETSPFSKNPYTVEIGQDETD